jgi:uncharacterized protein (TIGR02118 family)
MAGADPQLRSAGGGAQRRGVVVSRDTRVALIRVGAGNSPEHANGPTRRNVQDAARCCRFQQALFRKAHSVGKEDSNLRKYEVSRGTVATPAGPSNYHLVALLHYDDVAAIQKALAGAEGPAAVADVQTFATGGADIFMFDTHARRDSPSRNQNTGAEAAPVFSYSRPPVGRGGP